MDIIPADDGHVIDTEHAEYIESYFSYLVMFTDSHLLSYQCQAPLLFLPYCYMPVNVL